MIKMWDRGEDPHKNRVFSTSEDGTRSEIDTKKNEVWKIKNRIRKLNLDKARGDGPSLLSLIVPAGDHLSRVTKMLRDKCGKASNVQNRTNRQSELAAIASAQQTLKVYSHKPDRLPNGLVLFTGKVVTGTGTVQKTTLCFQPFRPNHASFYLCDNKFHTEPLTELLDLSTKLGFIVMDATGTLFATGSIYDDNHQPDPGQREVLHTFKVPKPELHNRVKQSLCLPLEKRHSDVIHKTCELVTQFYIHPRRGEPTVSGLVLAGAGDLNPSLLSQSEILILPCSRRWCLRPEESGGDAGFLQAIELSGEALRDAKLIHETEVIGKYFDEIDRDSRKFVYGVVETMKALEVGAVETLIVWGGLDMKRYVLENVRTGETVVKYLSRDQEKSVSNFKDEKTKAMLVIHEEVSLVKWLKEVYKQFGCFLELVTNKSRNGSKFCGGFGGVRGVLRYSMDMLMFDES